MRPPPAGLSKGGEAAWARLWGPPLAHRGLWAVDGAPENSLQAISAAARAGYGVELDVRIAADGEAMVFHDDDLRRMTGAEGRLEDRSRAELARLRLAGSDQAPPTLAEALAAAGPDALVLVELKPAAGRGEALAARACEVMEAHDGPVAMISFSARAHHRAAARSPGLLRGVHLTSHPEQAAAAAAAKAHFLLPELGSLQAPGPDGDPPRVAWTIRTPADRTRAAPADNVIFEGVRPEPRTWR